MKRSDPVLSDVEKEVLEHEKMLVEEAEVDLEEVRRWLEAQGMLENGTEVLTEDSIEVAWEVQPLF